jgi:nicotinamide mononucleotide adenylyltransferase
MDNASVPYDTGVIHGRFQVLHNDHLKYLLAGQALCRHLVVGITNPEPLLVREETADLHRSTPLANPLTYFERYHLVRAALTEQKLAPDAFSIVPLPINLPERYRYYVPMDAVFFVSIYDAWGERKLRYFQSLGLRTHILRRVSPAEKGLSAGEVRRLMVANQPWEHLVPPRVSRLLTAWDIPARLQALESAQAGQRPQGASAAENGTAG